MTKSLQNTWFPLKFWFWSQIYAFNGAFHLFFFTDYRKIISFPLRFWINPNNPNNGQNAPIISKIGWIPLIFWIWVQNCDYQQNLSGNEVNFAREIRISCVMTHRFCRLFTHFKKVGELHQFRPKNYRFQKFRIWGGKVRGSMLISCSIQPFQNRIHALSIPLKEIIKIIGGSEKNRIQRASLGPLHPPRKGPPRSEISEISPYNASLRAILALMRADIGHWS